MMHTVQDTTDTTATTDTTTSTTTTLSNPSNLYMPLQLNHMNNTTPNITSNTNTSSQTCSSTTDRTVQSYSCDDFTGAELRDVVNEAALHAARTGRNSVSMYHLQEAMRKVAKSKNDGLVSKSILY
mmetsp:Transcript_3218/g.4526  ORF Transcript_3218/g.4526 Transcript_3218/m.4526 type:complete len:126 (-) Transcript_3218:63-440(-)